MFSAERPRVTKTNNFLGYARICTVILEGIVTTLDEDGAVRVAPMGPTVEPSWQRLRLRPFTSSHTFENLKRTRQGVFHVTSTYFARASKPTP